MKVNSKVFSVLLISVLFTSVLLMMAMAQQNTPDPKNAAKIFDPVKDMFTSWQEGNLSVNIAKYLFLALLTIFIYSIAKTIPGIKNLNFLVVILFSLIVSFLATAYLAPSEVYAMLVSYGAMGMILGAIIPLIILVFFSIQLGKEGSGGSILQVVLWSGFIVFLVYKLIMGLLVTKVIGLPETIAYGVIIAIALIFLIWRRQIMMGLFKSEIKDVKAKVFEEIETEDVLRKTDQKRYNTMKERVLGK